MAKKETIRPGMLVSWRTWYHDPFQPQVCEPKYGLVVHKEYVSTKFRGVRTGVLVDSGEIKGVETHKLRVISRPYVQYKGLDL